jgi:hypothetical protein
MDGTAVAADWLVLLPVTKAVELEDGRLEVEGIASDESVDLEEEIVKASGLVDTLRILEERGVLDWDHGRTIGQIDKARLIPVEEARERFPELREWFGRDYQGRRVFYLHGWVDAPLPDEPENRALLDARHALKSGHRLGFSISGGRVRRGQTEGPDGRIYPSTEQAILTRVALTPCPVNTNTVARLAKSLSAAMEEPAGDEPVLVVAKGVTMAGTGTEHASFSGGRALTKESLHGGVEDTLWACPLCAIAWRGRARQEHPPLCQVCGGEMVRVRKRGGGPVRKGLSPEGRRAPGTVLGSIAYNLTAQQEDNMSTWNELQKGVAHLAQLLGIAKGALDIPDEDEEEPDEALEDVGEEAEEAAAALRGLRDEDEEEKEEAPVGEPPEADEPPDADDLDDMLEALGEMDDERDAERDAQTEAPAPRKRRKVLSEEEEEEEEDEEDEMTKAVHELLAEDDVLGPVLDADEAFGRAFEIITKAVGARLDALTGLVELQGEALDVLLKSAAVQEEREQAREAAAQKFAATRGAMPAGRIIHKSPKDGAEDDADGLNDRITKALQAEVLTAHDAGVLRKQLRYGQVEEVKAALDRANIMPTGAE